MRHFVVRTIRKGIIRIARQKFFPDKRFLIYDGRLDNKRYACRLYYTEGILQPFVYLWGTEENYRATSFGDPRPELVDGYYPWAWWGTQEWVNTTQGGIPIQDGESFLAKLAGMKETE